MFLHGCSDYQDQLFCIFELRKKASLALRIESLFEKIFSIGMLSAVWLGEDRKRYAVVVGLDLLLGLPMVRGVHGIGLLIVVLFLQCIVN